MKLNTYTFKKIIQSLLIIFSLKIIYSDDIFIEYKYLPDIKFMLPNSSRKPDPILLDQILINMARVEEETSKMRLLQYKQRSIVIYLDQFKNNFPSKARFIITRNNGKKDEQSSVDLIKEYQIKNFSWTEGNKLQSFDYVPQDPKHADEIIRIYNQKYDNYSRPLKRSLLYFNKMPYPNTEAKTPQLLFSKGFDISYKSYNRQNTPESMVTEIFTLVKGGKKQILKTKESVSRKFDEKGNLIQESVRETAYSWKAISPIMHQFYNVSIDSFGLLEQFDVFLGKGSGEFFLPTNSIRVAITRDPTRQNVIRTVSRFEIRKDKLYFLDGFENEKIYDKKSQRLIFSRELNFDYKQDQSTNEIPIKHEKETKLIFNTSFTEIGSESTQRLIHIKHKKLNFKGHTKSYQVLKSYREVSFIDDPKTKNLDFIVIDFFWFNKNNDVKLLRQVQIKLLEISKRSIPTKIRMKVHHPLSPDENYEEIISKDCNYIIEEAISKNLFTPIPKNKNTIIINQFNEKGQILSGEQMVKGTKKDEQGNIIFIKRSPLKLNLLR